MPLTSNSNLSRDLGTRHRAALGISEASDAVVVIVSEETGKISIAINGSLTRNLTPFLNTLGKAIVIATMYLGRVGPISLALALKRKKDNQNIIRNPMEEISVG